MTVNLIQILAKMPPAIDAIVKVSLILTLGWLLHGALARRNPRWRVLLWRVAAVGAALVPLLGLVMPRLKVAVPREGRANCCRFPMRVART